MAKVCPKCGLIMMTANVTTTCPYLIGRMRTRQIATQSRKIRGTQKERLETLNKISEAVNAMPAGKKFSTQELLRSTDLFRYSSGDLLRVLLDWLSCRGILQKIEFNFGRRGHVYMKRESVEPCENLGKDELGDYMCNFSFMESDGAKKIVRSVVREEG